MPEVFLGVFLENGLYYEKRRKLMNNIENVLLSLEKEEISDIHISEGRNVSYRKDGEIYFMNRGISRNDIVEFTESIGKVKIMREQEVFEETDCSFKIGKFRYRGNIYTQRKSVSISIRRIPGIKTIEELGLPEEINKIFGITSGIVFITGPTGSGKTTTLSAIIEHINRNYRKHIITIEDPIEYIFESKKSIVTQREVGVDTQSFSGAIKSSLRQDPDIIVIGEIRDAQTMKTALRAAETGHLCIATLHTTGSMATIERIIGMFSEGEKDKVRYELSIVLKAVMSQKLIKSEKGRIPVVEFMNVDKPIANMIREEKLNQIPNYIYTNKSKGMISMDCQLVDLYRLNRISREEMVCQSIDKEYVSKRSV